jgi:hypothetical protein
MCVYIYIYIYIYIVETVDWACVKLSDLTPSGGSTKSLRRGLIFYEDHVHDALYLARWKWCLLYVVCVTVLLALITFLHLAVQVIALYTADIPNPCSFPKLICAVFAGDILNFLFFFCD